jgi:gluconolactonase
MFFANIDGHPNIAGYSDPAGLPDAVWRFSPQDKLFTPVTSRADILVPDGIRVNKDFTKLYVTDTPIPVLAGTSSSGAAAAYSGSPAIFLFDLTPGGFPINKPLISLSRRGILDSLHIKDRGRIWTGESEGVVVRSPKGRVLGIFNSENLLIEGGFGEGDYDILLANFAFAGDTLLVLALQRIWTVKLAEVLVDPKRFEL